MLSAIGSALSVFFEPLLVEEVFETVGSVLGDGISWGGRRRSDNLGECDYRGSAGRAVGDDYYFRADPVVPRGRRGRLPLLLARRDDGKSTHGSLNSATRFLVTRCLFVFARRCRRQKGVRGAVWSLSRASLKECITSKASRSHANPAGAFSASLLQTLWHSKASIPGRPV
ncbi:hypothetical protein MTO96_005055 [Rhipicephalus appendiculatus]